MDRSLDNSSRTPAQVQYYMGKFPHLDHPISEVPLGKPFLGSWVSQVCTTHPDSRLLTENCSVHVMHYAYIVHWISGVQCSGPGPIVTCCTSVSCSLPNFFTECMKGGFLLHYSAVNRRLKLNKESLLSFNRRYLRLNVESVIPYAQDKEAPLQFGPNLVQRRKLYLLKVPALGGALGGVRR